jgi:hypothetical protein
LEFGCCLPAGAAGVGAEGGEGFEVVGEHCYDFTWNVSCQGLTPPLFSPSNPTDGNSRQPRITDQTIL